MSKLKIQDSFLLGLIMSLLLPPALLVLFFKIRYTTTEPFYYAIWKLAEKGFLAADMFSCLLPSLVLFFILYKIEWWKASRGLIIGTVPYFILLFYLF